MATPAEKRYIQNAAVTYKNAANENRPPVRLISDADYEAAERNLHTRTDEAGENTYSSVKRTRALRQKQQSLKGKTAAVETHQAGHHSPKLRSPRLHRRGKSAKKAALLGVSPRKLRAVRYSLILYPIGFALWIPQLWLGLFGLVGLGAEVAVGLVAWVPILGKFVQSLVPGEIIYELTNFMIIALGWSMLGISMIMFLLGRIPWMQYRWSYWVLCAAMVGYAMPFVQLLPCFVFFVWVVILES